MIHLDPALKPMALHAIAQPLVDDLTRLVIVLAADAAGVPDAAPMDDHLSELLHRCVDSWAPGPESGEPQTIWMNRALAAAIEACVLCGDDAELQTAPGPGEPTDEYTCTSCGCSFTSDRTVTAPKGSAS